MLENPDREVRDRACRPQDGVERLPEWSRGDAYISTLPARREVWVVWARSGIHPLCRIRFWCGLLENSDREAPDRGLERRRTC